ncbi:MAG: ABC transporter ATP-binding protein/permease [Loktanella sp.]|nr:ABC transporter ATP-binding protein/permease [Loktanella sp.]
MKLMNPIPPFAHADTPPPDTLLAFLRWAFRGGFRVISLGALISVFAGVLEVVTALILGLVIDAALAGEAGGFFNENLWLIAGVCAFFLLLRPVTLGIAGVLQSVMIEPPIFTLILSRLYRHTLGQSVSYFDDDFAGRISQKQMQAARAGTQLVVEFVHTIVFALASLVGSIFLVFTLDIWLAALMAVWVAAYVLLIRYFMPRIRKWSKAKASTRAMVTGQVVDTITNIKTVKLFAHDSYEDRTALEAMDKFRVAAIDYGWTAASFRFWLMALAGILPLLLVGATLVMWTNGATTAGAIAATGAISLRLAQMTGWVSFTLMTMYANVGELEDAIRTLSPHHTLVDQPNAKELVVSNAEIRMTDLTFTYGGGKGGITDLNLTIAGGEKIGIVGASGAGKSTLLSLLLRLYEPEGGTIEIDGQDIQAVTQESLRRQIGMVTQETAMFNRSAMANIRYGKPDADDHDIYEAARRAEADDFIGDLSDFAGREGYDAHLGERGVKLSGGQRQRIAIARTILKDAPILVLDEATSALDSEVEAAIQQALETIMEGKTVIAIAHRLSTLARMDRIIVLEDGQIVEQGAHHDLLRQDGLYARYWNRQSGGFIDVQEAAE